MTIDPGRFTRVFTLEAYSGEIGDDNTEVNETIVNVLAAPDSELSGGNITDGNLRVFEAQQSFIIQDWGDQIDKSKNWYAKDETGIYWKITAMFPRVTPTMRYIVMTLEHTGEGFSV